MSFSDSEFASKKRVTRKEEFLAAMEPVVPWKRLVEWLEAYYPKGQQARPPMGLERMLQFLVVQNCFGLSDEGLEDAVYEIQSIRQFVGVDLNSDVVPDATTVLKFRRLLEEHKVARAIFEEVNASLAVHGLYMKQGTIVDATIIAAPGSTKNESKGRDPEMHQTKKGNERHFGMKVHIGVDVHSGLVHTVTATAANEADINQTANVLHREERVVFADAGYTRAQKREEVAAKAPHAKFHIAAKRSKIKAMPEGPWKEALQAFEHAKAQVRALVEHPFQIIKRRFGYGKVRYRELQENLAKLESSSLLPTSYWPSGNSWRRSACEGEKWESAWIRSPETRDASQNGSFRSGLPRQGRLSSSKIHTYIRLQYTAALFSVSLGNWEREFRVRYENSN